MLYAGDKINGQNAYHQAELAFLYIYLNPKMYKKTAIEISNSTAVYLTYLKTRLQGIMLTFSKR
jgi:hypothetical protein